MRTCLLVVAAMIGVSCMTVSKTEPAAGPSMPTGFLNKTMNVDGADRSYVVYVPRDYRPDSKWPLILFLHGAGERGDDGLAQSDVGIGRAIRFHPDRFPCIVVMPQCPKDVWWDKVTTHIDVALRQSLAEYSIDPDRVYLTGLSMGGYASWQYGAEHSDQFAAIVPICGGGKSAAPTVLAKVPIWAFHGEDDSVVRPSETTRMVEAVQKAGGTIRCTMYPGVDHNSWDKTYGDPEVISWLLQQRRPHR